MGVRGADMLSAKNTTTVRQTAFSNVKATEAWRNAKDAKPELGTVSFEL